MGKLIRGVSKNARFFVVDTTDIVQEAQNIHKCSPTAIDAFGRLLTAGVIMGSTLKGNDVLTLRTDTNGLLNNMVVTADANGGVKGYLSNPTADVPLKDNGKSDVGGLVGKGILKIIKDMGLKEPYVGQCQLQTGEIAEDLTYYFATSEQIPSAVGLGVLMNKNNTVRQAGGFIIQLMPFTSDEIIEKLEKRIAEIDSVTMMLERGLTPEGILEEILGDFGLEITDKIPAAFVCDCSKERVSRALSTLSKKDLDDIINDGESIEVKCQFCNKAYEFSVEELKELRK